jgi:alpha-tubulin suppressor-like RCC1 family protein
VGKSWYVPSGAKCFFVFSLHLRLQEDGAVTAEDAEDVFVARPPRLIQYFSVERALFGARVVKISCGGAHHAALTGLCPVLRPLAARDRTLLEFAIPDSGYVYTWGNGQDGRLGHDSSLSESEPRVVLALLDYKVADVSAGGAHTAAVTVDGSLFTWGRGRNGRLGNGSHKDVCSPFHVKLNRHSVQVGSLVV